MGRCRVKLKKPVGVAQVLETALFARRGRPLLTLYHLQKSWPTVVGETLAQSSYPKLIEKDRLTVVVDGGACSQTLHMMESHWVAEVCGLIGRKSLKVVYVHAAIPPGVLPTERPPKPSVAQCHQPEHRSLIQVISDIERKRRLKN